MTDDEAETAAEGDENCGVISTEGVGESSDDEGSTGEGVGDKRTHGRGRQTSHLKSFVYTSNSFVDIRDGQQNVVQAKCSIVDCKGQFDTCLFELSSLLFIITKKTRIRDTK